MILKIDESKENLIVEVALGFDDSLKFQVEFPLSDVKELMNGDKKHLFWISKTEDEASSKQDELVWGDDL